MSASQHFPPAHLIPDNGEEDNQQADTTNASGNKGQDSTTEQKPQLALPAPNSSGPTHQLNVTESDDIKHTIRFDNVGPLVINSNGTLSRIHNWAEMTDAERERTVRVLGKRNMLRKEAILKDEDSEK